MRVSEVKMPYLIVVRTDTREGERHGRANRLRNIAGRRGTIPRASIAFARDSVE